MGWRSLMLMLALAAAVACDESAPGESPANPEAPPPPPPPPGPALKGDGVAPGTVDLEALERIDVAAGLGSSAISIESNDAELQPALPSMFDGDTATLARSNAVNPLTLAIKLQQPVRLRAVRAYLTYSTYDWVLVAEPDADRLLARAVTQGEWSQIDLEDPVETSEVSIEVLRLQRDNYVHVNELELYADP